MDVVSRQIFRAWAGNVSPDIMRIVKGPDGGAGPGGPGGGAGPGGGSGAGGAPGGIPGMEPVSPGGGPAGPASARPMLQKGSTGNAVREMQELLVRRGAAIDPDGDFGSRTQRAVIEFQRSKTLGADGIVGPLTWNALEAG